MRQTAVKKKRKIKISVFKWAGLAVLFVYAFSMIAILVWAFITSFKGRLDFYENPIGFPASFEFGNYLTAIENFYVDVPNGAQTIREEFFQLALNSILYALGGSFVNVFVCCIVAYVTARYNYKFSSILYTVVLVVMIVPVVGNLPSEIQMLRNLHLYDTIIGAWVLKANFLGMYFMVFHATFKGLPKDFAEAAQIDGAGNLRVFLSIMLPMVKTTFTTIMLIRFIEYWNDYQMPLMYIPSYPTLSYGLYDYTQSERPAVAGTPMQLAGCMILFIPIFIIFIVFQKKLTGNISMGGIKE